MLLEQVRPGDKIEIQTIVRPEYNEEIESGTGAEPEQERKVYYSSVYDVLSDEKMEIYMPAEKSKLLLLTVDAEYDFYFYTASGLYQCFGRVVDRYKTDAIYLLLVEMTSSLRKYQRREYYRLSCALGMSARALEKDEIQAMDSNLFHFTHGIPFANCVMVDISGGGLRFIGNKMYSQDSYIYCKYRLKMEEMDREHTIICKVISTKELEDKPGVFEHRVKYVDIDPVEREEIIRFIFEADRMNRKKDRRKK